LQERRLLLLHQGNGEDTKERQQSPESTGVNVRPPLQTVGPYLMTGKLLLQQFWRNIDDWKKPLTKEQQERWVQWMTGLAEIEVLHVPRWYGFPKGTLITLS
jgi:hypothetical protein